MNALFSPDSRFMQTMSRIWDLVVLNFLFLLCCVPIFTIGAASTALYSVCFRMDTERETGVIRGFFSAFARNFWQSTWVFLLLIFVILSTILNTLIFYRSVRSLAYPVCVFPPLTALAVIMYAYAFPLIAYFSTTSKGILTHSLILGIGYLPRTLVVTVLNLCPVGVLWMNLYTFLNMGFLWVFFYFSAAAYLNTKVLVKIFSRYHETKEEC